MTIQRSGKLKTRVNLPKILLLTKNPMVYPARLPAFDRRLILKEDLPTNSCRIEIYQRMGPPRKKPQAFPQMLSIERLMPKRIQGKIIGKIYRPMIQRKKSAPFQYKKPRRGSQVYLYLNKEHPKAIINIIFANTIHMHRLSLAKILGV